MVQFGTRRVGDGQPCFITLEAGPTHDSLASAKRLVGYAAEAKADAVKFQIFDPDRLVADRKQLFTYDILIDRETNETETVSEPLYDILCRRCLTQDEWRELKAYSDSLGLAFFATIAFDDEVDFLAELGCHSIKIASADVNHFPLLKRAAKSGMCLQIDTGSATIGEIEAAVDVIRGEGNENIIIHHCPSGYPARLESINLRVIPTLKRMFPAFPIAYSDHTAGWDMDIAAIALGANLVEKTISEDRTTRSVEHIMSIEPPEMKAFMQAIRDLETAMGTSRRLMTPAEREKRMAVRRSLHVRGDLPAGHVLKAEDIDYRRPGFGLPPGEAERVVGKALTRAVTDGTALSWPDIAP
ncbi:MAG: N-acetylneuraminate synthase family protein [Kiloniellaceae bacterium]